LRNLRKIDLISISLLIGLFIAGCGTSQIKETGVLKIKTLKSQVILNYSAPGSKIKKKSLLAVKDPDLLRFEIKGFFNEPFFMLTSKGNSVKAYFVQDNAYFEGQIFDSSSDSLASLILNRSGKLRIKDIEITPVLIEKEGGTGILDSAEFSSGDTKVIFSLMEQELNVELSEELFELTPPKNARRIGLAELNGYISKWKK